METRHIGPANGAGRKKMAKNSKNNIKIVGSLVVDGKTKDVKEYDLKEAVQNMRAAKESALKALSENVDESLWEGIIQEGNEKTGDLYVCESRLPVIDCSNCKKCSQYCYAVGLCQRPNVMNRWALNSALRKHCGPNIYWEKVVGLANAHTRRCLRIGTAGDILPEDIDAIWKEFQTAEDLKIHLFCNVQSVVDKANELGIQNDERFCFVCSDGVKEPYAFKKGVAAWNDIKDYAVCPGECSRCLAEGTGCWAKGLKGVRFIPHGMHKNAVAK